MRELGLFPNSAPVSKYITVNSKHSHSSALGGEHSGEVLPQSPVSPLSALTTATAILKEYKVTTSSAAAAALKQYIESLEPEEGARILDRLQGVVWAAKCVEEQRCPDGASASLVHKAFQQSLSELTSHYPSLFEENLIAPELPKLESLGIEAEISTESISTIEGITSEKGESLRDDVNKDALIESPQPLEPAVENGLTEVADTDKTDSSQFTAGGSGKSGQFVSHVVVGLTVGATVGLGGYLICRSPEAIPYALAILAATRLVKSLFKRSRAAQQAMPVVGANEERTTNVPKGGAGRSKDLECGRVLGPNASSFASFASTLSVAGVYVPVDRNGALKRLDTLLVDHPQLLAYWFPTREVAPHYSDGLEQASRSKAVVVSFPAAPGAETIVPLPFGWSVVSGSIAPNEQQAESIALTAADASCTLPQTQRLTCKESRFGGATFNNKESGIKPGNHLVLVVERDARAEQLDESMVDRLRAVITDRLTVGIQESERIIVSGIKDAPSTHEPPSPMQVLAELFVLRGLAYSLNPFIGKLQTSTKAPLFDAIEAVGISACDGMAGIFARNVLALGELGLVASGVTITPGGRYCYRPGHATALTISGGALEEFDLTQYAIPDALAGTKLAPRVEHELRSIIRTLPEHLQEGALLNLAHCLRHGLIGNIEHFAQKHHEILSIAARFYFKSIDRLSSQARAVKSEDSTRESAKQIRISETGAALFIQEETERLRQVLRSPDVFSLNIALHRMTLGMHRILEDKLSPQISPSTRAVWKDVKTLLLAHATSTATTPSRETEIVREGLISAIILACADQQRMIIGQGDYADVMWSPEDLLCVVGVLSAETLLTSQLFTTVYNCISLSAHQLRTVERYPNAECRFTAIFSSMVDLIGRTDFAIHSDRKRYFIDRLQLHLLARVNSIRDSSVTNDSKAFLTYLTNISKLANLSQEPIEFIFKHVFDPERMRPLRPWILQFPDVDAFESLSKHLEGHTRFSLAQETLIELLKNFSRRANGSTSHLEMIKRIIERYPELKDSVVPGRGFQEQVAKRYLSMFGNYRPEKIPFLLNDRGQIDKASENTPFGILYDLLDTYAIRLYERWMNDIGFLASVGWLSLPNFIEAMREEQFAGTEAWKFLNEIFDLERERVDRQTALATKADFSSGGRIPIIELPALLALEATDGEIQSVVEIFRQSSPKVHRLNAQIEAISQRCGGIPAHHSLVDDVTILSSLVASQLREYSKLTKTYRYPQVYDHFLERFQLSGGLNKGGDYRPAPGVILSKCADRNGRVAEEKRAISSCTPAQRALVELLLRDWRRKESGAAGMFQSEHAAQMISRYAAPILKTFAAEEVGGAISKRLGARWGALVTAYKQKESSKRSDGYFCESFLIQLLERIKQQTLVKVSAHSKDSTTLVGALRSPRSSESGTLQSLRPYSVGDDPRRIVPSSTGRFRDPLVRRFEESFVSPITAVVNIHHLYSSDKAVEELQDMIIAAAQRGLPIQILFAGRGVVAEHSIPFSRRQPALGAYAREFSSLEETIHAIDAMFSAEESMRGSIADVGCHLDEEVSLFAKKGSQVMFIGWAAEQRAKF